MSSGYGSNSARQSRLNGGAPLQAQPRGPLDDEPDEIAEGIWQTHNGAEEEPLPADDPMSDPLVRDLMDLLGPYHPMRRDPVALRAFRDSLYGEQSGGTRSRTSDEEKQFWGNPQKWNDYVNKKL